MQYFSFDKLEDALILLARIALVLLFVISGYGKFANPAGTAAYMAAKGLPLPLVAAWAVIFIEFIGGLVVLAGFYTRPVAFLFAIYTLITAIVGHPYWILAGADQAMNMTQFYKNIGIAGGFLLLALQGPGRYSLDRR